MIKYLNGEVLKKNCRRKESVRRQTKENQEGVIERRMNKSESEKEGILSEWKRTSQSKGSCVIAAHRG